MFHDVHSSGNFLCMSSQRRVPKVVVVNPIDPSGGLKTKELS